MHFSKDNCISTFNFVNNFVFKGKLNGRVQTGESFSTLCYPFTTLNHVLTSFHCTVSMCSLVKWERNAPDAAITVSIGIASKPRWCATSRISGLNQFDLSPEVIHRISVSPQTTIHTLLSLSLLQSSTFIQPSLSPRPGCYFLPLSLSFCLSLSLHVNLLSLSITADFRN